MLALIQSLNGRLNGNQLNPDRLRITFDAFWPSFEESVNHKITTAQDAGSVPKAPERSEQDLLEEILLLLRQRERRDMQAPPALNPRAVRDLRTAWNRIYDSIFDTEATAEDYRSSIRHLRFPLTYILSSLEADTHGPLVERLDEETIEGMLSKVKVETPMQEAGHPANNTQSGHSNAVDGLHRDAPAN